MARAKSRKESNSNSSGANLGAKATPWVMADKFWAELLSIHSNEAYAPNCRSPGMYLPPIDFIRAAANGNANFVLGSAV